MTVINIFEEKGKDFERTEGARGGTGVQSRPGGI